MKKLLSLLLFSVLLCSCEKSIVRDGRELYMLYFEKTFKDPESIKIYKEEYTIRDDKYVDWVLDVGGKNSYGGMVRKTFKVSTFKDAFIKDEKGNMFPVGELKDLK